MSFNSFPRFMHVLVLRMRGVWNYLVLQGLAEVHVDLLHAASVKVVDGQDFISFVEQAHGVRLTRPTIHTDTHTRRSNWPPLYHICEPKMPAVISFAQDFGNTLQLVLITLRHLQSSSAAPKVFKGTPTLAVFKWRQSIARRRLECILHGVSNWAFWHSSKAAWFGLDFAMHFGAAACDWADLPWFSIHVHERQVLLQVGPIDLDISLFCGIVIQAWDGKTAKFTTRRKDGLL